MKVLLAIFCSVVAVQSCNLGETKKDTGYQYTCVDEDGSPYFKATACVSEGKVYNPGQQVENSYYAYECKSSADGSVGLEITGCKSEGQMVAEGGKVKIGNYMWSCTKDAKYGFLSIQPSGCIVDNGEIPMGREFEEGGFWYTCTKSATSPIVRQIGGCIGTTGGRVASGATYNKNGFVVTCDCKGSNGCTHRVTGCLEDGPNPRAHAIGESWPQGTAPFVYLMKCGTCTTGSTITKTINQCSFSETVKLDPGCMKEIGGKLVACGINEKQTLQIYTENLDARSKYSEKGYRSC